MGCESWKLSAILLSLISLLASVRAQDQNYNHDCMSNGPNGGYKSNSPYRANLNTLLSSLSQYISDKGFHQASFGNNEDRVNALVLCRGDQTLDQCRRCVQAASYLLPQLCPEQKQAIIWYESCMLRYSNESISGTLTNDPGYSSIPSSESVSSPDELRAARTRLSDVLRDQAADGMSGLKVGAGNTTALDSGTLYGLMQCTPDLSPDQCDNCLKRAAEIACCDSAPAIRVVMPSCNLRFQFYSFYNVTRLRELQVPLSEVPVPSPPGTTVKNTRSGKTDDNTTKVVIIIVVPVAVCIILGACAAVFQRKRMNRRPYEIAETTNEISTVDSLQYDFRKIRAATNDFAVVNKLGQGGFGAVYRGKLLNDQDIAVKRLAKDSRQGNVEFKNEVLLVAKLQHRNLVRLLGFSLEDTERVLIYEFAQNGSLDRFIFDRTKRSYLNWDKRYKIIEGIARGLMYLHEDSRLKIIHRDLKASNVLLDGNMNPKIADFGLAKLFEQDETQGYTSKIAGTYGYMAPEYAMHGHFSIKSDVFSFGVLVLEILSAQRNNYIQNEENVGDLLTSIWKNWQEGTAANMIDSVLLTNDMGSLHEMLRCMHMGLLCVQEKAAYRPTMTSVVSLLISPTMVLPVPSKPAFYMASRRGSGVPLIHEVDSKELKFKTGISKGVSQNYMSVSELHPR